MIHYAISSISKWEVARIVRQLLNFIIGGFVHVVTKPFASGDRKMTLARTHAAEKRSQKGNYRNSCLIQCPRKKSRPICFVLSFGFFFIFKLNFEKKKNEIKWQTKVIGRVPSGRSYTSKHVGNNHYLFLFLLDGSSFPAAWNKTK